MMHDDTLDTASPIRILATATIAIGLALTWSATATAEPPEGTPSPSRTAKTDAATQETSEEPPESDDGSSDEEIRVTTRQERDESPHVAEFSTGAKADVPFLESSRRVDVLDRRVMRDAGAVTAPDLWRYIPNAVPGERGTLRLRGFDLGQSPSAGAQLYDGVRASPYNLIPANLYNIERIEVLKGPAGVLYGPGQPGGLVNYVLKKPQREQWTEITAHADSHGERYVALDTTGPLTLDETWLYRVNFSAEDTETFRNFEEYSNTYIAPSISWQPEEDFKLTLLTEFFKDHRTAGRGYGVPVIQGDPFALPRDYSVSNPDDFRRVDGMSAQLQLDWDFSEELRLDATVFGARSYYVNKYHEGQRSADEDAAGDPVYRRQYRDQHSDTKTLGYDVHFVWEPRTDDAFSHRAVVGTDLTYVRDPQFPAITAKITQPLSDDNPDGALPVNLRDPFGSPLSTAGYGIDSRSRNTGRQLSYGLYGDYRVGWDETLFVDVGARYDGFSEETRSRNLITDSITDTDDDDSALLLSGGLVYAFAPEASAFYAYNEGFRPQAWFSVNNPAGPFPPLEWYQHEVGLQYESLDKDLGATLTAFQITREHELVPDTRPDAEPGANRDVGTTRSEGIEATVAARFDSGTAVRLAYGYVDAFVHDSSVRNRADTDTIEGESLGGVPSQTASLTVTQDLPFAPVRVFGAWTHVASHDARTDDTDPLDFRIPSYDVFDIGATYYGDSWEVRLGVDNVLDEDYATVYRPPAHATNRGEPRTLTLSFSARF